MKHDPCLLVNLIQLKYFVMSSAKRSSSFVFVRILHLVCRPWLNSLLTKHYLKVVMFVVFLCSGFRLSLSPLLCYIAVSVIIHHENIPV